MHQRGLPTTAVRSTTVLGGSRPPAEGGIMKARRSALAGAVLTLTLAWGPAAEETAVGATAAAPHPYPRTTTSPSRSPGGATRSGQPTTRRRSTSSRRSTRTSPSRASSRRGATTAGEKHRGSGREPARCLPDGPGLPPAVCEQRAAAGARQPDRDEPRRERVRGEPALLGEHRREAGRDPDEHEHARPHLQPRPGQRAGRRAGSGRTTPGTTTSSSSRGRARRPRPAAWTSGVPRT